MAFLEDLVVRLGLKGGQKYSSDLKKASRATDTETKGITNSFMKMGTAIKAIFVAEIVRQIARGIASLVEFGEQTRLTQESFKKLSAGIGQGADAMLKAMQRGSKGVVNNLNLMLQANQAMLLGIPVTVAQMEEMTRVALLLGRAVGRDATSALSDLVVGFGRQSALILDNLGITLKVTEAHEAFARTLGKEVSQLTDAEKRLAFFTVGMEKARAKAKELEGVTGGLQEKVRRTKTSFENAGSVIGQAFARGLDRALNEESVLGQILGTSGLLGLLDRIGSLQVPSDNASVAERTRGRIAELQDQLTEARTSLRAKESFFDLSQPGEGTLNREIREAIPAIGEMADKVRANIDSGTEGLKDQIRFLEESIGLQQDILLREIEKTNQLKLQNSLRENLARIDKENLVRLEAAGRLRLDTDRFIIDTADEVFRPKQATENVFDPTTGRFGDRPAQIEIELEPVDLEETERAYGEMSQRIMLQFTDIPRSMADEFAVSLARIQTMLTTLGIPGGIGRVLGGASQLTSGLGQLGLGRGVDEAGDPTKFAKQFQSVSKALGQFSAGLGAALGALAIVQSTTKSVLANNQIVNEGIRNAIIAGGFKIEDFTPEQQRELGIADLPGGAGAPADAGSQTFSSVTRITESQADLIQATLETMRIQDVERNDLLEAIRVSNINIEFMTSLSGSSALLAFQGV